MTAEDRLAALGIVLPPPAAPVANYLPFVVSGSLLAVSGQLAIGPSGKLDPAHTGKLGVDGFKQSGTSGGALVRYKYPRASQGGLGRSRQDFALHKTRRFHQRGAGFR